MPPKRAKSGGGSAGLAKWEQALLEAQFEEEEWKPNVTLVVGNKMEDYRHVDALHAVVAIPQRKLFSTVSKTDLFELVKELGNPKAKKGKETPQFYEICESVKPMLDEGQDVPILVLAKLLKFKLLDIKANDLKRRETEKKAAEDKAKGKTPGKDGKRPRSKSPAKGKGKKTPEPPAVKKDTKLKRRGEEDEENKYIDDEPDDGPQHYVLVHGFHQPQLVMALADVGVSVDSLLKITSEDYTIFQTPESGEASPREEQKKDEQVEPVAGAQEAQQDIERQQRQKAEEELKRFWKFLDPVLRRAPGGSRLHDMARLEYVVVNTLHPSDWEDVDKKLAFGTAVFEDVACKIYDMYDWKRQFQHYLSNMKLLHVPLHGEAPPVPVQPTDSKLAAQAPTPGIPELDLPAAPPDVDMRYYNELMNTVPQESVSIPLIMHCMLEQVSATEEDREPPSERPVPPRQDGVNPRLASHMSGAAVKLALSVEEQMALDGELDLAAKPPEDKNQQRPLLLQYGDGVGLRTHHLKRVDGFDPQAEELKMVSLLPVARLCELPPPSTRISKERAARLQELLHFCATGNLSLSEIDRAFKQFVFESMAGSTTDRSGMVLEPPLADEDGTEPEVELDVPWDDPFPFYQELMRSGLLKAKKKQLEEQKTKTTEAELDKQDASQRGTPVEEEGEVRQTGSRPTSSRSRSRPTSARQGSAGSNKSGKEQSLTEVIPDENKAQEEEESKEAEQKSQEEQEEEDQADHVTVNLIEATQKRQLDDWCFAEHFEPEVLVQVLDEANFKYSHMDSYYHKRDHSMMMVFHNPLGPDLHNHTAWNTYLHSDVGFRNYLEHVTENISDWVRVEEAKHQAELLAKELALQRTPVTTPDTSRPSSSKSQRKRSQSPKKKSRSPSGKRSKRGSAKSPERPSSAARPLHVRENSLKAWKEEQDIIKAEEEKKAKEKEEKRAKSANKKASRERGSSAGSNKSKSREKTSDKKSREDKEDKDKTQEPVPEIQEPTEPEVILPFTGYDVGNELVHAAGESVTLFPCDGGIIRTEKTAFVQDGVAVRTSVLKDGHLFVIHILDPRQKEDAENAGEESVKEKADLEKSEKEEGTQSPRPASPDKKDPAPPLARFGSFTAVLNDGMCLSLSNHGPSGKPKMPDDMSAKEVDIMTNIPPASTPTPPPPSPSRAKSPRAKSPKGKPKSPKGRRKEAPVEEKPPEPEEAPPEPEEPEEAPIPPFQQLFVSCPDGLNIRYFLEKDIGIKPETVAEIGRSRLLVRQTYPFKTRGLQKVEDLRKKPAMQEVSRCVNSDGTVVKVLQNGSTQVLFADGTISENPGAGPIGPYGSRSSSPSRPPQSPTQEIPEDGKETPSKTKKAAKGGRKSITTLQEPEPVVVAPPVDEKANQWVTTSPSGERVATKGDGTPFDVKPALLCQASDPESGAVVVTREDKVISVHRPDDSVVVEHCDGTRITTFYKDVIRAVPVDENETGESPRMESARVKHVKVECVGYATLLFNSLDGSCMTVFGNGTSLMTNLNGTYQLYHGDGGRLDMDADGTTVYAPRPDNDLGHGGEEELALGSYLMRHNTEMCCEMVDLQGNVFQVAVDGTTSVIRAGQYGEEEGEEEGEEGGFPRRKKLIQYGEHCPRFFIIHANGSGTELLRPKDVAEYLSMAARDPTCALIQDPLPEYPGVTGITVLKPHTSGISQSWLKKLDEEVIMPKGLKSRDLKTMSVSAEKTPGPSFGTNVGKGLSVGSVMSSPRPEPVLHCPDTLEIRQLVQYKPVSEDLRRRLQLGLKAYAEHVLERDQTSASLMVQDPRTEEEKIHAADLASQTIFGQGQEPEHYESADKKVTVMEGDVTSVYEKAVEVPPPEPPPTPRNKRTQDDWDRDRRELAEEQEGRNALKNKDVPPYFESEMGKHFLMSQAPDMDALTRELAHDPRRDGSQVIRSNPDSPISVGESPQGSSGHLVRVQETFSTTPPGENTPITTEDSPSLGLRVTSTTPNLRPTNPTPAHASGTGTPTPLRPKNPTPHAAGVTLPSRPGNPTPTQDSTSQGSVPSETPSASLSLRPTTIPEHPEPAPENLENSGQFTSRSNQLSSADGELVTTRSLLLDVNNQPRRDTVRLPRALDGGKPGSLPNEKFSLVEEPVRRKVQTSSVAGASSKGVRQMGALRGLMAVPDDVDFGVLREGNTYVYTVQLKNVGVDSCRFKVKQPPPSTGLRVLYNPGPIAAGMKADLNLEIYAIAVGAEGEKGVGRIAHHIEITTETDLLYLPVTATILTAAEHDNRSLGSPRGGKAPAAKLISTKPPSGQGILRPRRDVLIEGLPSMG
ncbi:SPAG17 [Branchiostoma lanceolatum]|uniref:SPAG17 protein n=1 Tax=Branchiostoma lanceolatum TaxID=7740 RepID=A0A8J9V725_BRALA|nr:SPAG17 [Branchiostoma lanceolatum]